MPIDFSTPNKLQMYDTGVLQGIRDAQFALACFLDGIGAINGNPAAGIKRYNASSKLFERWNGGAYEEMPLAYLKTAGGALTGYVTGPDPVAANHLATRNYVDYVGNQKASAAALAAYMPITGGLFTGSISSSGSLYTAGNIQSANSLVAAAHVYAGGVVFAADGTLTTTGQFAMTAYGTTTPVLQWEGGSYMRFDRGSKAMGSIVNNKLIFEVTEGRTRTYTLTEIANDIGGNYGGYLQLRNTATGAAPTFRVNPGNGLEIINANYSDVNATFADDGGLVLKGRFFGNNGGDGIGAVHVQQGGSASGGAIGDWWLIW